MKTKNVFLLSTTVLLAILNISAHAKQICVSDLPKNEDTRYTISTDGTEVTDTKTGLTWERCTLGQKWDGTSCSGKATDYKTWKDALTAAKALGNGYRLPNVKEYVSIVDRSCSRPAINSTIFPGTPAPDMSFATAYWTSTPSIQNPSMAIVFDANAGKVPMLNTDNFSKSIMFYGMFKGNVRAVRNK